MVPARPKRVGAPYDTFLFGISGLAIVSSQIFQPVPTSSGHDSSPGPALRSRLHLNRTYVLCYNESVATQSLLRSAAVSAYIELHCHSYFSLLDGASSPEALLDRALELGMPALALTDHDGLYGAVRFVRGAQERNIRPILGAEITLEGEYHLLLLAQNRTGYANLCCLISRAQLENGKGNARLCPVWLKGRTEGLIALTGCRQGWVARLLRDGQPDQALRSLRTLKEWFAPGQLYLEIEHHLHKDDSALRAELADLADHESVPLVATNNVHYATRSGHRLQDLLVAIRNNTPIQDIQCDLHSNSEHFLKGPEEMARLFAEYPQALGNTLEIADRCEVSLSFRQEALPSASTGTAREADLQLAELCEQGLPRRYPRDQQAARRQLKHELNVIQQIGLSGYFLLVWDIVRYAQNGGIQVRGRGSAANSIVAYLLGITNVDPLEHRLLFERFLSAEARVMPDIDLDFCSRRREEVIQYVYQRYGEAHVGMVCNYITYRKRSAVRDVGKALGLSPEIIDRLAKTLRGPGGHSLDDMKAGLPENITEGIWLDFGTLTREIQGLPRHLGIHVGGMCITQSPLMELVPLERATMPGRVVIQWDKDSLEDAGLIKIDILSLRTLSAIDECLSLLRDRGVDIDLDTLPLDDPAVYDALQRADTIAAFQVESRAQQQALIRMKPRRFADIVVEVAIIRPGPLQGNMVHPFFQRRMGLEPVTYLHPSLEPILAETLGVIVFQEQVIRVAMAMADFSPGEADLLRRAMSRHRSEEEMASFRDRFITGATALGAPEQIAEDVFRQLAGFAGFGFCKSHAAAFAKTAYDTLYLRAHYTSAYYCGVLNNQPMGFYAPRVVIGDARRHGVDILSAHVNHSQGKCSLEGNAIRLGYEYVDGFGETSIERVLQTRETGAYLSLSDFCQRTRLPRRLVQNLILAGATDDWNSHRRQLLWDLGRLRYDEEELPLIMPPDRVELEPMTYAEALMAEYGATGVSADGHLMELFRERLDHRGILTSQHLPSIPPGRRVKVAGMVVVRQAPPTAKGFVFLTLEDEWGLMNIIVKPPLAQAQRPEWTHSVILIIQGVVQRVDTHINVMADRIIKIR